MGERSEKLNTARIDSRRFINIWISKATKFAWTSMDDYGIRNAKNILGRTGFVSAAALTSGIACALILIIVPNLYIRAKESSLIDLSDDPAAFSSRDYRDGNALPFRFGRQP